MSKNQKNIKQLRRSTQSLYRSKPYLTEKQTILIVCEGKNTEPSYFRQFKLKSASIKTVGSGFNTLSLVKKAIEISEIEKYDQIWCVYDKDDCNDIDFNMAFNLAINNKFHVAYSNQAFEYWLILHFEDHQGAKMHRSDYKSKINKLINQYSIQYDGNRSKLISKDFFDLLRSLDDKTNKNRTDLAIERARRNYNHFDHSNLAKEESSTTVFKLVEEILKYI